MTLKIVFVLKSLLVNLKLYKRLYNLKAVYHLLNNASIVQVSDTTVMPQRSTAYQQKINIIVKKIYNGCKPK